MTKLEKYNKLTSDIEILKFYFKTSPIYKHYFINKYKSGVKITNKITKERNFYELNKYSNTILKYQFKANGRIGTCVGEIDLDIFEDNLEYYHNLVSW